MNENHKILNKEYIIKESSSREKLNKNNNFIPKLKDEKGNDKDISFDDIAIPITKSKMENNDSNIIKEKENNKY